MKNKAVVGFLVAFWAVAAVPSTAPAQRAGFQAGVVQPQFGFPTPQPPVIAVRSTFTVVPIPILPLVPAVPRVPVVRFVPLVPSFPTVIVPNAILVPGQTHFPAPIVHRTPVPAVATNITPGLPIHPAGRRIPPFGTPRADVLRLLGQPSVTVVTSTGETLHFPGGVTVIIQNGQVAGPR